MEGYSPLLYEDEVCYTSNLMFSQNSERIDFLNGLQQAVFSRLVIHDILQIKLNIMYLLCGLQSANLDSKNSGLPATVGKAQRAIVF